MEKSNKEKFKCAECGFEYWQEKWAKKCEAWCKEHHTCNLEITKHVIKEKY